MGHSIHLLICFPGNSDDSWTRMKRSRWVLCFKRRISRKDSEWRPCLLWTLPSTQSLSLTILLSFLSISTRLLIELMHGGKLAIPLSFSLPFSFPFYLSFSLFLLPFFLSFSPLPFSLFSLPFSLSHSITLSSNRNLCNWAFVSLKLSVEVRY